MEWIDKYNLAKIYYEYYGDLEIKARFKTKNGYDYDENGIFLGRWIDTQRAAYHSKKMSTERIQMLKKIGMRFETNYNEKEWLKKYELAKAYYEYYRHLEIPSRFKTTNGYDYDENGVSLGYWIDDQRKAYHGTNPRKITEEQIALLQALGMRFETINDMSEQQMNEFSILKNTKLKFKPHLPNDNNKWIKNYNLAKNYYKKYGNLEIETNFKTTNGVDYDENGIALGRWIFRQREAYQGKGNCKITEEQIKKLDELDMKWYISDKKDFKSQKEEMDEFNNTRKQIEILNRVRSYLNTYDEKTLPTKEEINNGLVDELNHKRNK